MKLIHKKAVTLVEIMFAVGFLALSFLPIIGVFASNMKVTVRDQSNIVAMKLCQEKLDLALTFPFEAFPVQDNTPFSVINNQFIYNSDGKTFEMDLRNQTIDGITYEYNFTVEDRPGSFTFQPISLNEDLVNEDSIVPSGFEGYKFDKAITVNYAKLVHRYKMSVSWVMKGGNKNASDGYVDKTRSYTLVTLKANLGANL